MAKKHYVVEITNVTLVVYLRAESEEEACDLATENWQGRDHDIILDGSSDRTAEIWEYNDDPSD